MSINHKVQDLPCLLNWIVVLQCLKIQRAEPSKAFPLEEYNQGVHHIFGTLEEAVKSMTDQELEEIAIDYASKPHMHETLSDSERTIISQAAQKELSNRQAIVPD